MAEGNENVMELRRWFRQTKAHNTMVLGKTAEHEETGAENINKAAGTLLLSKDENEYQLIVTENQGYTNFKHRRAIFYVKQPQEFFVLVDEGFGTATGYAKLYFHLCDEKSVDNVLLDKEVFGAHTTFNGDNNLLVRTFGEINLMAAYPTRQTENMNKESPMQLSCGSQITVLYDILQYYTPYALPQVTQSRVSLKKSGTRTMYLSI